jgi:DNA adenine methylase
VAAENERLAGVTIENLDWSDFIDRYDRPETLFYLDPALLRQRDGLRRRRVRPVGLRPPRRAAGAGGRTVVLSLNDRPEVREIFGAFRIVDAPLTYTIRGGEGKQVREVIVMDRKEPAVPNLPE